MMIGSWIIRDKFTKLVMGEVFSPPNLDGTRYEAIPIGEYLGELNRKIREEHLAKPLTDS